MIVKNNIDIRIGVPLSSDRLDPSDQAPADGLPNAKSRLPIKAGCKAITQTSPGRSTEINDSELVLPQPDLRGPDCQALAGCRALAKLVICGSKWDGNAFRVFGSTEQTIGNQAISHAPYANAHPSQ